MFVGHVIFDPVLSSIACFILTFYRINYINRDKTSSPMRSVPGCTKKGHILRVLVIKDLEAPQA